MPMHDWTKVDAGIYHAFHHSWISEIHRALMGRLPPDYYSLPEQHVLTLQNDDPNEQTDGGVATKARPRTKFYQETPTEFYLRKQKSVAIHHVSGDRVVAVIEVVSPGNKNSAHGLRSFVTKAREFLQHKIHLLIIDPIPVCSRVPDGLHAAIIEYFQDDPLKLPEGFPLSVFAYECDDRVRTYLEPFAVGDLLPEMPVFLYPEMYIDVPLEATYMAAWNAVPRRWQKVIEN